MANPAMPLPPGATLVEDPPQGMKLPPGATLVDGAPPQQAAAPPDQLGTAITAAKNFGGQIVHNWNPMNQIRGFSQFLQHPVDTLTDGMSEQRAKVPNDLKKGNYNDAFIHGVGGTVPLLGPAYAKGMDAATANDPVEGGKALADMVSMKAVPALYRGIGKGLGAVAPTLAETALGIRGKARAFGATPGEAILTETKGIRPTTIFKSSQERMERAGRQLDNLAANSPNPVDIGPGRATGEAAVATAERENSLKAPGQLRPMVDQLTTPGPKSRYANMQAPTPMVAKTSSLLGPNGQPIMNMVPGTPPKPTIAPLQSATDALAMKRRFGKDFIDNWDPTRDNSEQLSVAKKMYHGLSSEFNKAVPGAEPVNQLVQSLAPVVKRSEEVSMHAGPGTRVLDRVQRPTGGMLPILFGLKEGGPVGAMATLAAQETLSSPSARMLTARTLYNLGRAAKSTPAQRVGQGSLLAPRRKDEGQ